MNAPAKTRVLLLVLAASAAAAQTPTTPSTPPAPHKTRPKVRPYRPPYDPNVIVLDPAHGGDDAGANLGSSGSEKDLNLAFAERLRTLLTSQGFNVVFTHASADDNTSADQRAELANRSRAVACLLLHASNAGRGIHLFTSALTPSSTSDPSSADAPIVPWDSSQSASLPRSTQLVNELATALNGLKVPLVVTRASVSPIDSMSCPAVAIEIAPSANNTKVADESYQQHTAESITTALTYWRQHARDQIAAAQAAAATVSGNPAAAPTPVPKPKPKPKPAIINAPDEVPLAPDSSTPKPAPIERRPPPQQQTPAQPPVQPQSSGVNP